MRPLICTSVLALSFGAGVTTASAQVLNPANGHYYHYVPSNVDWVAARASAESTMFQSVPGHLVTVADQAEQAFLATLNLPDRVWIGGFQDTNHPSYSEPAGGWVWVTGEPFVYTNWNAPSEPNDSPPNENAIEMNFGSTVWNDISDAFTGSDGFIIEWETGSVGNAYCGPAVPNSTGLPGTIAGVGSPVVAMNILVLRATDLPPSQFGYFLNSQTSASTFPVPNSQGTLCVGGPIGRYNASVFNTGALGMGELQLDLADTPTPAGSVAIQAGETWHFTAWYRDLNPLATSNFTDGVSLLFL